LWEILSKNAKNAEHLGKYATVLQAEIFAVLAGAHEIQMHARLEKYVSIGCDRQVALKALQAATMSPLVQ
jgi:hypothetical protein